MASNEPRDWAPSSSLDHHALTAGGTSGIPDWPSRGCVPCMTSRSTPCVDVVPELKRLPYARTANLYAVLSLRRMRTAEVAYQAHDGRETPTDTASCQAVEPS